MSLFKSGLSAAVLLGTVATAAAAQMLQIPTFVTDPVPKLRIGSDSGGPPAFLFARASDARELPGGHFVVSDCAAREVRSYDATGRHLATTGLTDGSTIQRFLWRLIPAGGDSIAAFEGLNVRLSLLGADLGRMRTVRVPITDTLRTRLVQMDVFGRFRDGSFVGRQIANPSSTPGIERRPLSIYRFSAEGVIIDSLSSIPGPETHVVPPSSRAVRMARTTVTAVYGDRLYVGTQNEAFVDEYDMRLHRVRRIPTVTAPVPMTDSIRDAWVAATATMMPRGGTIPAYGPQFADSLAAYAAITVGTDGRLWAQDPFRPGSYPLVWTAYHDARPVARVELPSRFFPTQFGVNTVLGFSYDGTVRLELLTLRASPLSNRVVTPQDAQPPTPPRCGPSFSR